MRIWALGVDITSRFDEDANIKTPFMYGNPAYTLVNEAAYRDIPKYFDGLISERLTPAAMRSELWKKEREALEEEKERRRK